MLSNYNYFLLEYSEYRTGAYSLTEDEFLDIYKKNCKDFRFTHNPIFRSSKYPDSYYIVDPSVRTRKSIEISNHYTLLIDNSVFWKNFPNRSNSLMCMYGGFSMAFGTNLHRVIPFDNAKFGVSPMFDLWASFNYLESELSIKIKQISLFFTYFKDITNIEISDDNYEQFKKDIIYLEGFFYNNDYIKKVENTELSVYHKIFMEKLHTALVKGESFLSFINKYINPDKNDFRIMNYNDLINTEPNHSVIDGNEVWTESKCLLVKDSSIGNIRDKI